MLRKFNVLFERYKSKKLLWTLSNGINYRKHLFWVKDKSIKGLIIERRAYNKTKKLIKKKIMSFDLTKKLHKKDEDIVWTCWLQGIDKAPLLVKKCIYRMQNVFGNDKVIIIDLNNYSNYVDLPKIIIDKYNKKIISHAHFSDILRVFLLAKYGGTWIDSTVYILDDVPSFMIKSDFFMFNNNNRNSLLKYSNWYISTSANNPVIVEMCNLVVYHWTKKNCLFHYLSFHIMLSIVLDCYTEIRDSIPLFSNINPHMLSYLCNESFNEVQYEIIKKVCPIQKMSNKTVFSKGDTYFNHIFLGEESEIK